MFLIVSLLRPTSKPSSSLNSLTFIPLGLPVALEMTSVPMALILSFISSTLRLYSAIFSGSPSLLALLISIRASSISFRSFLSVSALDLPRLISRIMMFSMFLLLLSTASTSSTNMNSNFLSLSRSNLVDRNWLVVISILKSPFSIFSTTSLLSLVLKSLWYATTWLGSRPSLPRNSSVFW